MTADQSGELSNFQVDVARLFFDLPESMGFLLAGGSALNALGLVARPTDDLDFFTHRGAGDVGAASRALVIAAQARGWIATVLREGPEFCRLKIVLGTSEVLVDLAVDSPPTMPATFTIAGPTLGPQDLAVRKTLALFGRAEGRDFTDLFCGLYALTDGSPCRTSPIPTGRSPRSGPTSRHGQTSSNNEWNCRLGRTPTVSS